MKILLVTTETVSSQNPSGGLGNSVERFAGALRAFDHDVWLLGPGLDDDTRQRSKYLTFSASPHKTLRAIDFLTLQRLNLGINALARARAVARAINNLQTDFRPDLIVYPNLGGISLFRPRNVPVVIRLSSDTRLYKRHGGYDNQSGFAMAQQIALEDLALKRADGIYAPSALSARVTSQRLGRPVKVLQTPFFLEIPAERLESLPTEFIGRRYLLFAGLLNRLKGVDIIATALPAVLSRHPDLHFVFAGREHAGFGGRSMKGHVLDVAQTYSGRIHFLGPVPHDRLYPLMKGAIAVVLPSRIDNLPNTCLEAMALGTIVIGTRDASFEEILTDGVTGFLCSPNSPPTLEETIERVLALPDTTKRTIGDQARMAVQCLEPDQTIPPIIQYFEQIISRK